MNIGNKILRIFLLIALLLILIDSFGVVVQFGLTKVAFYGILSEAVSDILMASALSVLLYFYIMFVRRKHGEESLQLVKNGESYLKGNITDVFTRSTSLLKKSGNLKKVQIFKDSKKITAQTHMSWKSFGEDIEITFFSEGDNVKAVITSKPHFESTLYDYGKNVENVNSISSLLTQS